MVSIYIDMDDVLCESNKTFLNILERDFNRKIDYSQITTFDLQECFDLSDEEFALFFDRIHDPWEIIHHEPIAGAREMLKRWKNKRYTVSVLTGRPYAAHHVSVHWLNQNAFEFDTFNIVDKYGRGSSPGDSVMTLDHLKKRRFDLAVEDSGKMARFLSEQMNVTVALLDRPWNRSMTFNHNVHRCTDWSDIRQKFETL